MPMNPLYQLGVGKKTDHAKGYLLIKYPHPDNPAEEEVVGRVDTLEKAQAYCARPESSFKEGDTSTWYFIGYVAAGSNYWWLPIWKAFKANER
jgi:hypothetical protein